MEVLEAAVGVVKEFAFNGSDDDDDEAIMDERRLRERCVVFTMLMMMYTVQVCVKIWDLDLSFLWALKLF